MLCLDDAAGCYGEAGDSTGLSFAEEVIDSPPHTSSVSTSFVDFTLPVCCCLGMIKFPTVFKAPRHLALESVFPSALNFVSSSRRRTKVVLAAPVE